MTARAILRLLGPVCLFVLAGCVTSDGPPPPNGGSDLDPPDAGLLDPDALGTVPLAAVWLDPATRSVVAETGEVDRATGAFTLGAQDGTLADDRSEGTLDQGGTVTFDEGTTDFAVLFILTPAGSGQTTGVLGIPTETADLDALGEVIYAGPATLLIEDGNATYDLTGAATIEASFDDGTVTTTLDGLSGEREAGLAEPPASVSNVGVLTVTGSAIEGATFSGGAPDLVSDEISDLSGAEAMSLEGAFFGPDADEVGVALVIDDSASGTVTLFGTILAD